jgi:hypothetical protein
MLRKPWILWIRGAIPLALASVLLFVAPAHAQLAGPPIAPPPFESWRPVLPSGTAEGPAFLNAAALSRRPRRALIGGAIGATAGVIMCTAISTLVDDSADGGLSFCPLDSYLLIGGAGFVVGAVIGWVT